MSRVGLKEPLANEFGYEEQNEMTGQTRAMSGLPAIMGHVYDV